MSEKRFSVRLRSECDGVVYSFFDGDKPIDVEMIVDKLNEQLSIIHRNEISMNTMMSNMEKLEKENEQLRDDLHNCRINKNIIREKLKVWQDVHKEYDIYSIKDFEELMKNDKR